MNLLAIKGCIMLEQCFQLVTPPLFMDLFEFTMQQLAPPVPRLCDEVLPDFLTAWLRHNHYLRVGETLYPHFRLLEDLELEPLAQLELIDDGETYYEVHIPDAEVAGLATVEDVQLCFCRQLARAA